MIYRFVTMVYNITIIILDIQSQSHITTNNQSASPSWCQAPIWDQQPIILSPRDFF
jgi:hypothetical protein